MGEPKVLIWDLETAGVNALKSDLSVIVCFGWKWLGDKKANCWTIDQYADWFSTERGLSDHGILGAALNLMEEADLLVAHYGDRFDRPFFNGRCAINGFDPPPPTKQRDTWYIAYKTFNFSSNRLANLAAILGVGERKYNKKIPDEWPGWWMKALAGNAKAIHEMADYCSQDVQTLEQVYLRLRPFDSAHPRIVSDRAVCRACGGPVEYRGFAFTKENKYRRFRCTLCGSWGRETKAVKQ